MFRHNIANAATPRHTARVIGIWNLVRIENGPAAVTGIETATPLPLGHSSGEKARE